MNNKQTLNILAFPVTADVCDVARVVQMYLQRPVDEQLKLASSFFTHFPIALFATGECCGEFYVTLYGQGVVLAHIDLGDSTVGPVGDFPESPCLLNRCGCSSTSQYEGEEEDTCTGECGPCRHGCRGIRCECRTDNEKQRGESRARLECIVGQWGMMDFSTMKARYDAVLAQGALALYPLRAIVVSYLFV